MLVHDGLELPAKDLHGRVPVHGFTIQQGSGSAIRGVEGSQRLPAFRARHPQVHGVLRVGREIDGLALFIQMDLQTTARGAEAAHRVGHGDGLGAGGQTAETKFGWLLHQFLGHGAVEGPDQFREARAHVHSSEGAINDGAESSAPRASGWRLRRRSRDDARSPGRRRSLRVRWWPKPQ